MNILIIGQGGREHALAWKAAQSPLVDVVWVAPGNAGTALENKVRNINIAVTDIPGLIAFANEQNIHLTLVGPEIALAAGIVDAFNKAHLSCFGPSQTAAQLETSKTYCKEFFAEFNIPTAKFACFNEVRPALDYLTQQTFPLVIKADGLAAGKGVVIVNSLSEAEETIREMLNGTAFGKAGQQIVIEEFLQGYEISYIVMTDGQFILPLASSQDHKRLLDNDQGLNTGGMGAFSPAPQLTPELEQTILNDIIAPTMAGLAARNIHYTGFLYAGLMITADGKPYVLEFNCRLGDPETQPILMRLQTDIIKLCLLALQGQLDQAKVTWDQRYALSVVMTAGGYPATYQKGDVILGLDAIEDQNCKVFHAGTQIIDDTLVTDGGRVLAVTALGDSLADAQTNAYTAVKKITWSNCYYRSDIGYKAIAVR